MHQRLSQKPRRSSGWPGPLTQRRPPIRHRLPKKQARSRAISGLERPTPAKETASHLDFGSDRARTGRRLPDEYWCDRSDAVGSSRITLAASSRTGGRRSASYAYNAVPFKGARGSLGGLGVCRALEQERSALPAAHRRRVI